MSYSTQQDILDFVEDNNVKFVRFAFCDIFGTQKNIAVLASNLSKALEEGVSVLNACTESGFPDYSSFLKTFRRLYGITPAEYRAQHRTMVR